MRRSFTYVAGLWKESQGVMRNSWEHAGKSRNISGYNAFLAENSRRYDLGASTSSPVTVEGLEAGKPYFLYGVLSDAAFAGAGTVSASVAADAVSGS